MPVIIECADGIQLEVIARRHRPGAPGQMNLADLPEDKQRRLADAISAAYPDPTEEDE